MLKPLTEEQIARIIETATVQFADKGFAGANINRIAGDAGVSVGVLYKYFQDKKALFLACVQKSLAYLDAVFAEAQEKDGPLMETVEELIRQSQLAAGEHPEYFRLYHQITVSGAPEDLVEMIEGRSAALYRRLLDKARASGQAREDLDPALFAFFFDNLMMMLHFSCACDYYRKRYQVYCGGSEEGAADERVRRQMRRFISGAFGISEQAVCDDRKDKEVRA